MTLTAGKYTCGLDLTIEAEKQKLWDLLQDADVVVQAFRRRSLERKGFGLNEVLAMANKRGKGIVYLDLTCYGPDGTFSERPGYQQIADAASGASYVHGKAYGHEDGVAILPALPISDMVTGSTGVVGVLLALRDRAIKGGSYHIDMSLTAINMVQLTEPFGLYPPEIVKKLQDKYQWGHMSPDLNMDEMLSLVIKSWFQHSDLLNKEDYFVNFEDSPFGRNLRILKPILKFANESTTPVWKHSPVPYLHHKEVRWAS